MSSFTPESNAFFAQLANEDCRPKQTCLPVPNCMKPHSVQSLSLREKISCLENRKGNLLLTTELPFFFLRFQYTRARNQSRCIFGRFASLPWRSSLHLKMDPTRPHRADSWRLSMSRPAIPERPQNGLLEISKGRSTKPSACFDPWDEMPDPSGHHCRLESPEFLPFSGVPPRLPKCRRPPFILDDSEKVTWGSRTASAS